MSRPIQGNGVKTIEDLRSRCRIDEMSGCWIWAMATTGGVGQIYIPAMRKTMTIRPAALYLIGKPINPGERVFSRCGRSLCCNPSHLSALTPAAFGKAQAASDRLKGNPVRVATSTRISRKRSSLTMEIAQQIRASEEVSRVLSERYGITISTVSKIKRGETWRDASINSSSAFNWRPA